MLKRLKIFGVAAVATLFMAATASAAPVIDFGTGLAGEGGLIQQNGGNLIGSNIPIGVVTVTGAPAGNGTYIVSGTASGSNPTTLPGATGYGDLDFNTSSGAISIWGCISEAPISLGTAACAAPQLLLSGTISSFNNFGGSLFIASGTDTKNASLLQAVGLPANTPFELFGFSLTTNAIVPGTSGNSTALSTDIRNTAVPEPATMVLLGTGLLAAFRARRRQA